MRRGLRIAGCIPSGTFWVSSFVGRRADAQGHSSPARLLHPGGKCHKAHSAQTELNGCPACAADWKAIEVSHRPDCPKNLLEEAMDTPNGALVRRCFRILNAKNIGLAITLADITEEEFQALELIEEARQEQMRSGDAAIRH
jgi:hypothetical protein